MGKIQKIADDYRNLGYGEENQKLLAEKKQKLGKNVSATRAEKKKYVLAANDDFKILAACKALAKQRLPEEDRRLVLLIKTQLETDWRKPLLKELGRLGKKYKIKTL